MDKAYEIILLKPDLIRNMSDFVATGLFQGAILLIDTHTKFDEVCKVISLPHIETK